MLWSIAVLLFGLWGIGFVTSCNHGGALHILLAIAVSIVALRLFGWSKGRIVRVPSFRGIINFHGTEPRARKSID